MAERPRGSNCRQQLPSSGLGERREGFGIVQTETLAGGPRGADVSELGGGA